MRQEVTRRHAQDKWSLDNVVYHAEVTEHDRPEQVRGAARVQRGSARTAIKSSLQRAPPNVFRAPRAQVRSARKEGVLVYGLSLDGAAWDKGERSLRESPPKTLFIPLPVLYVTAITKAQRRNKSGDYGPYGGYECPVYKYQQRTDAHLIFSVTLSSKDRRPSHWIMRGTAILCSTEVL